MYITSTVFLKHRSNWDNVRCAVRSFTWGTILKSADPLDAFDRAIGEDIGRLVPTTVLCSRSGDKEWFDSSCRELMMLSRLLIMPGVVYAVLIIWVDLCFLVLRPRESMVLQGNAHNERARNTLKHSTCSHKWWETLKGSIFGVKPFIPALRGPGGGLVVARAVKASLLGSQFDCKQCLSSSSPLCLVSLSLGSILWPSGLLSYCVCFLILTHIVVLILWVYFLYF